MPATSVKGSLLNSFFLVSCSCHFPTLHFASNVFQSYLLKLSLFVSVCLSLCLSCVDSLVADPDFTEGGRQLLKWVCKPIILLFFCRKLHENERILDGPRVPGAPLDPPLPFHPDCPLCLQRLLRDLLIPSSHTFGFYNLKQ